MRYRRILSLWFPRLAAERLLRAGAGPPEAPFAVVAERRNRQVLSSLSAAASAEGLRQGQPLRDAQAMCPHLLTRPAEPHADAAFLTALRRWAGKFSPWVAEEKPEGLIVDITGCAHLFGGEEALVEQVEIDCGDLGLTIQVGLADTVGAAWALARYAGQAALRTRSGDAIDQEAPATRARAAKRRSWERGGPAPVPQEPGTRPWRIAPPGKAHSILGPLPVAALRIGEDAVTGLSRVGIRTIGDLTGMPRAALARRFGQDVVLRLDQAMGGVPEAVSPARPPAIFAVRLTLPDPIGLDEDIRAAIDRLLPELEKRLQDKGRGARRLRMQLFRAEGSTQTLEIGLARPSASPDRIRPLLVMKLDEVDAGFGIDCIRIEAHVTEPVHARQHRGHIEAAQDAMRRLHSDTRLEDLIGRLGSRIGLDRISRAHPADSHIPEKTAHRVAAAWSEPAKDWPRPPTPRPLVIWRPEPVTVDEPPPPLPKAPATFRWRGRNLATAAARGPERIAPEWWLDEPEWRTGVRDYWQITADTGERLWLYYAHGGTMSGGWFCQGRFA
ncbi:DNA polymerase Y family protein [Psychromarinibacter sp. C21-152]|uniref:DNA-directed DNA polymerase n=1 Tax=Psychromarinibacter sediminicola TaxID=3033385 RepID=A0AAE3NNR6_9RHOB|nr:DNA polymerase Y family protein [Psychromarinibacter sediminicola]MDF0599336.1 DNA polymerase Y family protein [Psychromarinibacter sediminicola]